MLGVLAFSERFDPSFLVEGLAKVQGHGEALGLDIDPGRRRCGRLGHDRVDDGRPGVVLGAVQRALEAVEAGQRHTGRLTESIGEERGRTPGDHRDQRDAAGQVSQQLGHARQRLGRARV